MLRFRCKLPLKNHLKRNILHVCWRLFVFYKVGSLRKYVFVWQQRYVSQYFVINFFALPFQLVDYFLGFYRVPIQDAVSDKAQAAGFIHYFFKIRGSKYSLIGEEYPTRNACVGIRLH